MKLLRTFTIAASVVLALAATATAGDKPCHGCGHSGLGGLFSGLGGTPPRTVFGGHKTPLPAFQAAPWYNYWPYDAHFQTPAPVTGAFYGPPGPGNFPVNPYFPSAGYGAMGYYGPGYGFGAGGAPPVGIPQPMAAPNR